MILLRGKDINVYKSNAIFKTWAWIWSATQITLQFFVVTKAKRKKFLINCLRSFLIWINTTPPPPHNETKTQINYYTKKMETKKKERKRTVISVKLSMYSPIIHRNTMWMKDRLLRQKQKLGSINSITVPHTLLSLSLSSFCSNFPNLSEILFISIYQQDCFCCSFYLWKRFFNVSKKGKKEEKKGQKKRISFHTKYCLFYFNASYTS